MISLLVSDFKDQCGSVPSISVAVLALVYFLFGTTYLCTLIDIQVSNCNIRMNKTLADFSINSIVVNSGGTLA